MCFGLVYMLSATSGYQSNNKTVLMSDDSNDKVYGKSVWPAGAMRGLIVDSFSEMINDLVRREFA